MTLRHGRPHRIRGWALIKARAARLPQRRYMRLIHYTLTVFDAADEEADLVILEETLVGALVSGSKRRREITVKLNSDRLVIVLRTDREYDVWYTAFSDASRRAADFYKIVTTRELGAGAFSTVYFGFDREDGYHVAIKVVDKTQCTRAELACAETEARMMAYLQHPSIVRCRDIFDAPEAMHVVMEYMSGATLEQRMINTPPSLRYFSEPVAATVLSHVLLALSYLEAEGVCHRDVKPDNILLSQMADDSLWATSARLSDFGLAAFVENDMQLIDVVGTPHYVAPEVVSREQDDQFIGYGPPVDVWATGIMMYWMLSGGAVPFDGEDPPAIFRAIRSAHLDLSDDEHNWRNISPLAKSFMKSLLNPVPFRRLSASAATTHPWLLKAQDHALPAAYSKRWANTATRRASLTARNRLRAAAWAVICMRSFLELLEFYDPPLSNAVETVTGYDDDRDQGTLGHGLIQTKPSQRRLSDVTTSQHENVIDEDDNDDVDEVDSDGSNGILLQQQRKELDNDNQSTTPSPPPLPPMHLPPLANANLQPSVMRRRRHERERHRLRERERSHERDRDRKRTIRASSRKSDRKMAKAPERAPLGADGLSYNVGLIPSFTPKRRAKAGVMNTGGGGSGGSMNNGTGGSTQFPVCSLGPPALSASTSSRTTSSITGSLKKAMGVVGGGGSGGTAGAALNMTSSARASITSNNSVNSTSSSMSSATATTNHTNSLVTNTPANSITAGRNSTNGREHELMYQGPNARYHHHHYHLHHANAHARSVVGNMNVNDDAASSVRMSQDSKSGSSSSRGASRDRDRDREREVRGGSVDKQVADMNKRGLSFDRRGGSVDRKSVGSGGTTLSNMAWSFLMRGRSNGGGGGVGGGATGPGGGRETGNGAHHHHQHVHQNP